MKYTVIRNLKSITFMEWMIFLAIIAMLAVN